MSDEKKKYFVVDYVIKGFYNGFDTETQAHTFANVLTDMLADYTAKNDIRWDDVDWKISREQAN